MGREWSNESEAVVPAPPEQVWAAIATGPGIDSWFMGRTEVDAGPLGSIRTHMGPMVLESTITHWDPPHHLAYRGAPDPSGRFVAFEYLVEARDQGSTVIRLVANGFLPGDDWEDEYEAMLAGGEMYFRTMIEYLNHFAGQAGRPVNAIIAPPDLDAGWAQLQRALGVTAPVTSGQAIRLAPTGRPPIVGVVDYAADGFIGVRSDRALYRFFRGYYGAGIGHHFFGSTATEDDSEPAWQSWLATALTPPTNSRESS